MDIFKCPICKRDTPPGCVEKHHGKPKCKGGKDKITVCIDCGDQIHKLFTNKELEKQYNNVPALLGCDKIKKWVSWVWNKPFGVGMKCKKRR